MKKILIMIVLMMCMGVSHAHSKFRALLVGMNYSGAHHCIDRLSGAVNDANDMYNLMTKTLGIDASSIKKLTEQQATRQRILQTFHTWLINGTEPGDIVFFQYAGHGIQVPDPYGTQSLDPAKKGKDVKMAEAYVPYDTQININNKSISRLIFDSEFHDLLSELSGRNITLFIDCCHSGGLSRDFNFTKSVTRFLKLPWEPWQTKVQLPEHSGLKGISRSGIHVRPGIDYCLFAAVQHYQSAYEYPVHCGENGAFTKPVLDLLQANSRSRLTNGDVFNYAQSFIHNIAGIPASLQAPLFLGSEHAKNRPFILVSMANPHTTSSQLAQHGQWNKISTSDTISIWVTGTDKTMKSNMMKSIDQADFTRLSDENPHVIIQTFSDRVEMYHAAGNQIAEIQSGPDCVNQIMQRLESEYLIMDLADLVNPGAPFSVDMWMDTPGKYQFTTSDRVSLYYRVKHLPENQRAYFTLLNVAPDGVVSMLYPAKSKSYAGPGSKQFLNAPVASGVIHSIPKSIDPKQTISVDLRIRLAQGQEYFKGIVSSEPVELPANDFPNVRSSYKGKSGRRFIQQLKKQIVGSRFWGTNSMRLEVNP
jgi:hypothetical protein